MHRYTAAIIVFVIACPAVADWEKFPDCPVLLDQLVYVPALESGVVTSVTVTENMEVTKGQSLAVLDSYEVTHKLTLSKLEYQHAYNLARDESGVQTAKAILADRQERLSNSIDIKGSMSKSELSLLKIAVDEAKAGVVKAENNLARAVVDARIKATTIELLEQRLKRHTVLAPCDGVVTKIEAVEGQWADMGKPMLAIAKMDTILVNDVMPASKAAIAIGKRARVLVGGVYVEGEVESADNKVLSSSSRGQEVRIHAKLQNKRDSKGQWLLRPGMVVKLEVFF